MLNKPTGDMLNAAGSATPQGLGTADAGTSTAYSREDHVHAIPALSGDVTNDGLSVTVAKLQSSPVAATTPASGQVLTWDGTQWAPATNSSGGGGGANGLTYYLNQGTAADAPTTGISGTPHQLGRTGESGQTTVTTGALTPNVWTLVAGFVSESTPIDPDVTLIPAGLWDFNVWAYGDANVNAGTSIRCRVYKYNGTTLTEIASPSSDQVINGTSAQYSLSVLVPQTTLQLTDRIYVAIEARATANGHTVTAQFGDSTPSHVHTSLNLVGGTGLWKNSGGVLQSPASLLVNADVDAAAGIAWSKIAPSYLGTRVKVVGRDAATIQGCIDLCTDADGEHPYTVLIPPIAGSYTESLTLKGSVSLIGLTTSLNADAVQITGAHTFTPASKQANTNRINFQNITFVSSGSGSNTITCSSATKYFSKLTFSGCIFSGDKANTYSSIKTDDNVSLYVDNCRFESGGGGSTSAGITQGNGPLYLSNNATFDIGGRALDVPASTTTTRTATVTAGVGANTTMTLTSGDTTGLAVGMKISGANLGATITIVSLTAPSTVVMSSTPLTSGSFTATFGQTPYVEIHDSVLIGKGAETVRLGNGLLACNTSNFTNTASGGSGINMLSADTVLGIVNSSFTISDIAAYTITAAAATCYAVLNSVSYSNSLIAAYSTLIGSNVVVVDYSARATSIENGGTGATTRQAALNALAGAMTANQVLAGNGTNITLRALASGDIPNLDTGKLTTGTLPVARGGTGATTLTGLVKGTGTTAMVAAAAADVATTLGSQTAATVYAAPAAAAGTPTFRALAATDIPNLDTGKITTGTLPVARGGTGATTLTGLVKGTGTTAMVAATSGTDYAPGTSALATGIVKSTTTTGALSIATAGTDYQAPIGTISGIVKGNGANALTAAVAADVATVLGSQTAATVYAAPAAAAGTPTFRALVAGDVPSLDTSKLTSGTLPAARGGTGTTAGIANINTTQIASLTTAQTANLIPQLTTSGLLSLTQMPTIPIVNGGTGSTTAENAISALGGVALVDGSSYRATVRINSNISPISATATQLTFAAGIQPSFDGHTIALNDVLLFTNQTDTTQRGPWVVTTVGTGSVGMVCQRPSWFTTGTARAGIIISLTNGVSEQGNLWVVYPTTGTDAGIVIGTSQISTRIIMGRSALPLSSGGTGGTDAASAKLNLGVQLKASCEYATSAALPANTASTSTLTANANGQLTIDGFTFASSGDRILVKNETATATNGIYDVTNPGSAGAPWVLTRAADYNTSAEINSDDLIPIRLGSVNRSTLWTQKNNVSTLGTDPIVFETVKPANINIDSNGNVYAASGSTGMSGGFIWAAAAAGTPTAAPISAPAGRVPLYYDTTANKLYVYNGGWKASAAFV